MRFIDGDYYESLADFSFGDMYSEKVIHPTYETLKSVFDKFERPIFFIETHRVPQLFFELRKFTQKCCVISHNSDYTFGAEIIPHIPSNVEKFWCQNYNYLENGIIESLPIGLERKRWFPEQKKQELLKELIGQKVEKTELVYMNFDMSTSPIRKQIFDQLKDKKFINIEMRGNGSNYDNYIQNLKKHKYVISPPGNGIDCHRNWEAIYLGCVPIVLDSHFARNVLSKFPSMIINDFGSITQENLLNQENRNHIESDFERYLKLNYSVDYKNK